MDGGESYRYSEAVHGPRSDVVSELRYRSFWVVCGRSVGSCCPRVCRKSPEGRELLLCPGGQEVGHDARNPHKK